jgi:glycosyltransferase involved in cell wall biosynthesis
MRRRIGERNRQRVQSLFSVGQMIEKYEALYRGAIDGGK